MCYACNVIRHHLSQRAAKTTPGEIVIFTLTAQESPAVASRLKWPEPVAYWPREARLQNRLSIVARQRAGSHHGSLRAREYQAAWKERFSAKERRVVFMAEARRIRAEITRISLMQDDPGRLATTAQREELS